MANRVRWRNVHIHRFTMRPPGKPWGASTKRALSPSQLFFQFSEIWFSLRKVLGLSSTKSLIGSYSNGITEPSWTCLRWWYFSPVILVILVPYLIYLGFSRARSLAEKMHSDREMESARNALYLDSQMTWLSIIIGRDIKLHTCSHCISRTSGFSYGRWITNMDDCNGNFKDQLRPKWIVDNKIKDNYKIITFCPNCWGIDGQPLNPICCDPNNFNSISDKLLRCHFRQCLFAEAPVNRCSRQISLPVKI